MFQVLEWLLKDYLIHWNRALLNNNNPLLVQTISGSAPIGMSNQGRCSAITLDGSLIAIGGPNDNGGIGAVWIFANNTGTYTEKIKLTPPVGFTGTQFGRSLSWNADGRELSIGAINGVFVFASS